MQSLGSGTAGSCRPEQMGPMGAAGVVGRPVNLMTRSDGLPLHGLAGTSAVACDHRPPVLNPFGSPHGGTAIRTPIWPTRVHGTDIRRWACHKPGAGRPPQLPTPALS